jgi:hypothetical protein
MRKKKDVREIPEALPQVKPIPHMPLGKGRAMADVEPATNLLTPIKIP